MAHRQHFVNGTKLQLCFSMQEMRREIRMVLAYADLECKHESALWDDIFAIINKVIAR
jgi:hypothetical protein